jgi:hypothetical protein
MAARFVSVLACNGSERLQQSAVNGYVRVVLSASRRVFCREMSCEHVGRVVACFSACVFAGRIYRKMSCEHVGRVLALRVFASANLFL